MPGSEESCGEVVPSLHEKIHEQLVVEEPDDEALLDAVEGCVEITEARHEVLVTDEIHERPPIHRVMTYLLGRYCAVRLSDNQVSAETDRDDIIERFGRDVYGDAIAHGWIEHWDSRVRLNPRCYDAAAKELAAKYGDEL